MLLTVSVGRYDVQVEIGAIVDGEPEFTVQECIDNHFHSPDFESEQENQYEVKHNLKHYVKEKFEEVTQW